MENVPNKQINPEVSNTYEVSDDYTLLVGHARTDGSLKSTRELHSEYVHLTDNLIQLMTDGVDTFNPVDGERGKSIPDYVVYLDKSGRPVSWLVRELWPILAVDENGETPVMPETKFVNIDREQWRDELDPEGNGGIKVGNLDKSVIRSLRSIFLANPNDRRDGLSDSIDVAPALFDNKTVLIVDEVKSTGRTLNYANAMFTKAFPKARIATAYWMSDISMLTGRGSRGAIANADLPVWYKQNTYSGRGVGNRSKEASELSRSEAQRLGSWFLGTRLSKPDPSSIKLRSEIHKLGEDVRHHKIFVEPSLRRDDDSFIRLALDLNGVNSIGEYIKLKGLRHQPNIDR